MISAEGGVRVQRICRHVKNSNTIITSVNTRFLIVKRDHLVCVNVKSNSEKESTTYYIIFIFTLILLCVCKFVFLFVNINWSKKYGTSCKLYVNRCHLAVGLF
jgi:hypothetical protein